MGDDSIDSSTEETQEEGEECDRLEAFYSLKRRHSITGESDHRPHKHHSLPPNIAAMSNGLLPQSLLGRRRRASDSGIRGVAKKT